MASPRDIWEIRIAKLINESKKHTEPYFSQLGDYGIYTHPSVYPPKYFPETLWYGQALPEIVRGKSFLEIGIGSALVSLHLAAAGSKVTGVDINPNAVEFARKNFTANRQSGTFVVSDIFNGVDGRFDYIFWNHPWQMDAAIPDELKTEKTFDEGYGLLKRFVAQARDHLNEGGSVLVGTSAYADLGALEDIYDANGFSHKVIRRGQRSIGEGVVEEYYIIELRPN